MRTRLILTSLAVALLAPLAAAQDQPKPGITLTVYNGGYGVVREVREVNIPASGEVRYTGVPTQIDPTTVHFRSLTDPAAKLLEQNYQYDLVSADKLLQKYVDQDIQVVVPGKTYSGKLLSFDPKQIVLQEASGITMIQRPDNVRDIRFGELPAGLLTRPTLLWLVATQKPGKQLTEVTYQTNGLGWHAEYVLVLNPQDTAADLSGWVSVDNHSGKTYTDAKLKFIAGEVHRVQPPRPVYQMEMMRAGAAAPQAPMEQKPFFEYHMYKLPRRSTVADNEIKQLEMFTPARGVAVKKLYLYSPVEDMHIGVGGRYTQPSYGVTSEKKVHVFVEFQNSEENKLGIPLPAGKVRVYKRDPADEAMEFVGEQQIDHTPKDEKVSLQVGDAFDIVGERKQTDFQVDSAGHLMKESIEITLRNHKDEDVTVRVKEPLYRWTNWEITQKSMDYKKLDSRTIAFEVPVKADGEAKVTYTVEYTW